MDGAGRRAWNPDVRPHLLRLYCGGVRFNVEPCLRYGTNYLIAWCHRCGLTRRGEILEAAAADALLAVYWGRARRKMGRPTIADRTRELHVSPSAYVMVKQVAERAYRMRLAEALMQRQAERLTPANAYPDCREHEPPACESLTLARRAA
jgi:hypothetical protein